MRRRPTTLTEGTLTAAEEDAVRRLMFGLDDQFVEEQVRQLRPVLASIASEMREGLVPRDVRALRDLGGKILDAGRIAERLRLGLLSDLLDSISRDIVEVRDELEARGRMRR